MAKTVFVDGDPSQSIMGTVITAAMMDAINKHRHRGLDQDGDGSLDYAADTGAADAYAIALSPVLPAYITGMPIHFKAANANTGASTLNVNALGVKDIKKNYNAALVADDIKAGQMVTVVYDGVNFQMLSATQVSDTDTDEKAKVSANDTTAGYLNGKLTAGAGVALTEGSDGGNETLSVSFNIPYIKVSNVQNAGTAGGTFTSGARRTRVINTEDIDTGNHCAINANQITLAAGTYECMIMVPAYNCDQHQAYLRNITDGADTLIGTSERTNDLKAVTKSIIMGRFTIAAPKVFEVQHQCSATRNDDGFGVAANLGASEIYTIAEFRKVA